jgi:hypothetical protein
MKNRRGDIELRTLRSQVDLAEVCTVVEPMPEEQEKLLAIQDDSVERNRLLGVQSKIWAFLWIRHVRLLSWPRWLSRTANGDRLSGSFALVAE